MRSSIHSIGVNKGLLAIAIVAAIAFSAVSGHASSERFDLGVNPGLIELSNESTVTVNDKDYLVLREAGLPAIPYRVVSVLLPQGHVVDGFELTSSGRATIAADFEPTLGPGYVTDDGYVGAYRPMVEWSDDSRRFPATPVVYLAPATCTDTPSPRSRFSLCN